jgi:hypothetical protein
MDTSPAEGPPEEDAPDEEEGEPRGPVHCSTGRLTRAQAQAVDRWRTRLREDRPLPGQEGVGEAARLAGATDHPRASTSDAIAAAVFHLLTASPPSPLELAGYAYRAIRAQWDDSHGRPHPGAPVCPPVSYYLPARLAAQAEELRARACLDAARKLVRELPLEAAARYPGESDQAALRRASWIDDETDRLGLYYTRQLPRGAVARLAVDHWAARSPDDVAAAAVDWCQRVHLQWHRARSDMVTLTR